MAVTVASGVITIDTDFDVEAFRRRVGGMLRGAATAIGRIAGASLVTAMGASALVGTGQFVAALTAALAPAIGAIGVIPAAALGAGAALGALALAFSGVADALEAGLTGDMEKFNKAIKDMAPAAQAAMREIIGLKPALDDLRTSVQGAFWAPLVGVFRDLGAKYLPLVKSLLVDIAAAMGGAGAELGAFLGSPDALESIGNAFRDIGIAVKNLIAGIPSLVRAFLPLIEVGATFLPGLTDGFVHLTERFAQFMERVAGDGSLAKWISDGLSAIGDLAQALGSIGSLLKTVFAGINSGGSSVLVVIGDLADRLNTFLQTAQGAAVLDGLGASLAAIGQILGDLLVAAGPGLGAALLALSEGLALLGTAAAPVGAALGQLFQAAAPLFPLLGTVLAGALTVLAGILQAVALYIEPLATAFSALATSVVPLLTEAFTALMTNALPLMIPLVQALLDVFMPMVPVLTEIWNTVISGLLPAFIEFQNVVAAAMIPVLVELAGVVGATLLEAFNQVRPILPELIEAGSLLIGTIAELTVTFMPLIAVVAQAAVGIMAALVQSGALKAGLGILVVAVQAVTGVFIIVKGIIDGVKQSFGNAQAGASALAGALRGALSDALNALRGIGESVRGFFAGAGSWLVDAGRQIIQGLISGIRSAIGGLQSLLNSVTGMIPDWKGPPERDKKLLYGSGRLIMQGLQAGIKAETPGVEAVLGRLTDQIGQWGAPAAPVTNVGGVTMMIDPSKIRSIQDVVDLVERLQVTSRTASARWERRV